LYSYTYDSLTGGILLNSSPTGFSKEPRPVYAPELDLFGFDKYWKYDKKADYPYMWAEANNYFYRGTLVAKLKGGNIFTTPEIFIPSDEDGNSIAPEPNNKPLRPIDIAAMVEANREMLNIIENTTVKKIVTVYEKHKDTLDCFHVAFSGGKDSLVLLDLVKKALPSRSFIVVFGDTGMEFPDTYDIVEKTRKQCSEEDIPFYVAKSHLEPKESWELFGPPSRVLRWCCYVHKSAPQTLKLREILGKGDYTGLDFVGVRKHESVTRLNYNYENFGAKQKGQFSHNSILDWTSAEIWLYVYANNIFLNETYRKGNARAGCLFCPMSGGASDYLRRSNYKYDIDSYIYIVKSIYEGDKHNENHLDSYISNGGWNARKNGRELKNNYFRCVEKNTNGELSITVTKPTSDWSEWIKTLGVVCDIQGKLSLLLKGQNVQFSMKDTKNGYVISIAGNIFQDMPTQGKIFRQVFRKAAYCENCGVCESNCRERQIQFVNGKIRISNCTMCQECHSVDSGCLIFHSLRHPQGGGKSMKSLNSFADHAPKIEWLRSFFELKERFFDEHSLGPMMFDMFRRFLRDASLIEKNRFTAFAELISKVGWESNTAQGIIFMNLAYENPQIEWYIKNFNLGSSYTRKMVEDMLISVDVKQKDANSIVKSYKRLVETPLGTILNFGYVTTEGKRNDKIIELARTKCSVTDHRVILYGLFKFAEKCNNYKEFTLGTLLNDDIERDGISPTRIFGFDREDMTPILLGLTSKYPEFITATFTHDLDKITLAEDKTSQDVLDLFAKEA
jgi:phosphoadenosine phosphosulfate reductase